MLQQKKTITILQVHIGHSTDVLTFCHVHLSFSFGIAVELQVTGWHFTRIGHLPKDQPFLRQTLALSHFKMLWGGFGLHLSSLNKTTIFSTAFCGCVTEKSDTSFLVSVRHRLTLYRQASVCKRIISEQNWSASSFRTSGNPSISKSRHHRLQVLS